MFNVRSLKNRLKEPKIISIILITCLILFVFIKTNDYGLTWDIPAQERYGRSVLKWYFSLGKDNTFLYMYDLKYYGPFFEVIVSIFEHLLSRVVSWVYVRGVMDGLAGVTGILAVILCGFSLKKPWAGIAGAIILVLYPRFFGGMFYNSKDIPLASAVMITLWGLLLLINNWKNRYIKYSFILGIFLGITLAIRVIAIGIYPLIFGIGFLYALYKIRNKNLNKIDIKKLLQSGLVIILSSLITATIFWPFVLISPLQNGIASIELMSNFHWTADVLFNGQFIAANELPSTYLPTWLLIGSPIITILLFILGLFVFIMKILKKNFTESYKITIFIGLLISYLSIIIIKKATLYDSYRQILFLIPPIALIAGYGFTEVLAYLKLYKKYYLPMIFTVAISCSYILVLKDIYILHPYEYIYFNELVGGLQGAYGKYETDYWGSCYKDLAFWLNDNYKNYDNNKSITYLSSSDEGQITPYLLPIFKRTMNNPEFYLTFTRGNSQNLYPNYKVIYTIKRFNTLVCEVKKKN